MKLKKFISGFLAFTLAASLVNAVPEPALASTETVSQTVFEMDIEALKAGTVPTGVTLNTSILDETASSASAGLISDVVTSETDFLAINLATAGSNLEGTATGVYTVEFVLNAVDGDTTAATKNGNIVYANGTSVEKYMIVRSREKTDFTVLKNNWSGTEYKAVTTVATAHYTITELNASTGAATSHTAKYNENSYLFGGVAHDSALSAWSGAPITGFSFKVAAGCRANIKSIKITRMAEVQTAPEMFEITASSEDENMGTVAVSEVNAENKATSGAKVTLTATGKEGHIFDGWYKNSEKVSDNEEYEITASAETEGNYVAKFIRATKVQQTVFELNIESLVAGTVPQGVTFNSSILDEEATTAVEALVSDVVAADTAFLTINLAEASADLAGTETGLYTIEIITNVNDSDDTCKNGTSMFLKGVADRIVFRARESSDICAMPNTWADLYWQANTGATASYGIENLNIYDGSAQAHYARRDTNPQYSTYANGHALAAGNASQENPINILTVKAAKDRRANIKSLRVVREAIAPTATYIIEARAEDDTMGSVDVSATSVETGESVTLTATPEEHYVFVGWYDGDTRVSSDAEWTFYPTESKTFVAKFEQEATLTIIAESENFEQGTVTISPSGPYYAGDEITLTATALEGYSFAGWYKDGADTAISTAAEYTIEASSETAGEYVAKFKKVKKVQQTVFELDIESLIAGTVPTGTSLNTSILNETATTAAALVSDVVTADTDFLTVNLAEASASLEGTGTGLYTIEIVTNVNDSDSTTKNGTTMYLKGISDTLVLRARESSDICALNNSGWTSGLYWRTETAGTASYKMENLNITTGAATAHWLMRGSVIQHTANANGQALGAGNASVEKPINVLTVKAAKNYRANIKSLKITREATVPVDIYNIGAETEDALKGSVTVSDASVETGESVTLTATPSANYIFDGWYDGNTRVSTDAEWTFVPTESKTYVAKFTYGVTYSITAESADITKGTVTISPDKPYIEGNEVTLKATALTGYVFDGWYKNNEKVSGSATYTVIASETTEGNYVAKFIRATFEEQPIYTFDIDRILSGGAELPAGITLNDAILDTAESTADNALKSTSNQGAETFITIDLATLVDGLALDGTDSGVYKVELAVNVKDDADAVNGTDLFAVNNGGAKQLLTASETAGVMVSKGDGMNGGGDSRNRTFVTYEFDLNVTDGTLTSMLTDQTGSNIFSSVANGQTVTVPGISDSDPVTSFVIKNIAGQRANIKSLKVSRNIALIDYGNDTPIFNETCVKLIGANGETLSGNNVTAAVKTITIDFKSVLDDKTVTLDTVYVKKGDNKLNIAPVHNDGKVTFDVNGLEPNSTYTVYVESKVKNTAGALVREAGTYSFKTRTGEALADITSAKIDGTDISAITDISENDKIDISVKYINTNLAKKDLYVVYTAYKGNELVDIKVAEYNDIEYTIQSEFEPSFIVGDMTDVTSVKIFALDSWNNMLPLDAEMFGNVTYTKTAEDTEVKTNSETNKVIVSAVADADDELLIEIVKGNKKHSQVLEGITVSDGIYSEDIPVAFFDTVNGTFTVEVGIADAGEYTVYVKNITQNKMLIDGKVVTFTDSTTYASIVKGLNTDSAETFAASLTDEVAVQLGLDILVGDVLKNEKAEVKALVYAEGLSETDADANKKMVSEYAAMVVINNNTKVTDEVAIAISDSLEDTIDADTNIKKWFDKYVVTDADKITFVEKLLATEPESKTSDKIEERKDINDAIKVALVLTIAKAPNGYTNIKDSFDEFKSAFGRTSVSSNNEVYETLIDDFANKTAFLKKYDENVSALSQGGGGGSSGGSSGGGFVISPDNNGQTMPTQPVPTPIAKNIFTDIYTVPWAEDAIVALKVKNVISGKTETEFCPGDKITREEFTKLIVAAFANDTVGAELTFDDAKPDAWYYSYIQKAKGAGLVNGMSDSYFGVGHNITRQDMAVMIFNAAKYKNVVGNSEPEQFPFGDDRDISDYAKEAVYTLKTMGIISGIDADNFAPKATATRAEAAVMIYRLLLK